MEKKGEVKVKCHKLLFVDGPFALLVYVTQVGIYWDIWSALGQGRDKCL